MQKLVILGSTGSVGCQTLEVLSHLSLSYVIFALVAHRNVDLLMAQCRTVKPTYAMMTDESSAREFRLRLAADPDIPSIFMMAEDLLDLMRHPEVSKIMFAMSGMQSVRYMFAAARASKELLIANKEAFLLGGSYLVSEARHYQARLIPVDSEHSALFQLFNGLVPHSNIRQVILTASGGPFLRWPMESLAQVSPRQACEHPTWCMGKKISVDSATLMNKGLELLEASLFFHLSPDQLDAVIHPQSFIHAIVSYGDGSSLMHMSAPDMRIPIAYALTYPEKILSVSQVVRPFDLPSLCFEAIDLSRFPCFVLAREVARLSHEFVIILNAANDYAVARFLEGRMLFTDIPIWIQSVLQRYTVPSFFSMTSEEDILLLNEDVHHFMATLS